MTLLSITGSRTDLMRAQYFYRTLKIYWIAYLLFQQGFFNFTSRRPRHLLHILELGYNVMYNDVDMVWLGDPFTYLKGDHDVYFTDDMAEVCSIGFYLFFIYFIVSVLENWWRFSFRHWHFIRNLHFLKAWREQWLLSIF